MWVVSRGRRLRAGRALLRSCAVKRTRRATSEQLVRSLVPIATCAYACGKCWFCWQAAGAPSVPMGKAKRVPWTPRR